jgi:hypothetical protein
MGSSRPEYYTDQYAQDTPQLHSSAHGGAHGAARVSASATSLPVLAVGGGPQTRREGWAGEFVVGWVG